MKRRDLIKWLAGALSVFPFVSLDAKLPETKPTEPPDTVPYDLGYDIEEDLFEDDRYGVPVRNLTQGRYIFETDEVPTLRETDLVWIDSRGMITGRPQGNMTPFGMIERINPDGTVQVLRYPNFPHED